MNGWDETIARVGHDRVVYSDDHVLLLNGRYQDIAAVLPPVDATVTDPPYSERTHTAYRDQEELRRRPISYAPWTPADVTECVYLLSPITRGWFVGMCDHVLIPAYEAALEAAGRYVFAPLMCVESGSRVRQCGDGHAQWGCYAMAARPTTREFATWGALRGAYVVPPGENRQRVASEHRIGGKPEWLMRELIVDHSKPGDVVLDCCAGGETTGRAAKDTGRRAILIEENGQACELAARKIRPSARERQEALFA